MVCFLEELSIEYSRAWVVHYDQLNQSNWGLQNVAGLGQLPAKDATLVVGTPRIVC
jgi:kynurenine formamidase